MNGKTLRRMDGITGLIAFAAVLFCIFFQINKGGPFRDINPFGVDPYDAVGSFAFQAAILVGVLTYARALRLWDDPLQPAGKCRLILRGNAFVLSAVALTLVSDGLAVILHPLAPSFWGTVLLVELAVMMLLTAFCGIVLVGFWRRTKTAPPPGDLTPADAIDDLWTLVRVPTQKIGALLPRGFVEWINRWNSDRLFAGIGWVNPRLHPWRFACLLGLLVGILLVIAQLQEGLPPSLAIGLLVTGIFVFGEFFGVLIGFAVAGGFLGLRPNLLPRKENS
jgi:hypothetical protein